MKNIVPTYYCRTLCVQTLIAIPRKSTLKSIFSYSFLDIDLKLEHYVLGIKTKSLIGPIFDLGLSPQK